MQLVTSTLTSNMTLALNTDFDKEDLMEASEWVALRLSERTQDQYFRPEGSMHHLLQEFIEAIQRSLEFILCDNLEVPYIWTHRKDYISNFDTVQKTRTELMSRDELWRVAILGARFKALCDRRKALEGTYKRMGVKDEYFEREVKTKINSLEVVVDVADWLSLKHYKQRKDRERDDLMEEDGGGVKKHKMPSRLSAYEIAQNTVVSRLAKVTILPKYHHHNANITISEFWPCCPRSSLEFHPRSQTSLRRGPGRCTGNIR
jgi:transcription elongation factor SPT6